MSQTLCKTANYGYFIKKYVSFMPKMSLDQYFSLDILFRWRVNKKPLNNPYFIRKSAELSKYRYQMWLLLIRQILPSI